MIDILLVLGGLVLLVGGGDLLVRGASALALKLRVTPTVIGLTVVAVGTSLPELVVSLNAASEGRPALAVGNVVGSNIFNVALILGIAALLRPLRIEGTTVRREWPVMFAASLALVGCAWDGVVSRLEGGVMLAALAIFVVWTVRAARRATPPAEQQQFADATPTPPARSVWVLLLLCAAGCGLLVVGATLLVDGAVSLARAAGVSERVVGLTLVAIGTSLPELAASVMASLRGRDDVAVANVIGSNIFNVLGILGTTALVSPLPVAGEMLRSDLPWMVGTALLVLPLMWTGLRVVRWEGALLIGAAAAYSWQLYASVG